jgi:hypothetical protein
MSRELQIVPLAEQDLAGSSFIARVYAWGGSDGRKRPAAA